MPQDKDSTQTTKRKKRSEPISLKPLSFEEALKDLLNTPPPEKTTKKKKSKKPKKSED